ncbi:hypothetical protein F4804DRAFT_332004 [Jackrogersella minutella]|nr:hypothetical protein F4804DRAFT_332004 [Jackrogersella minutella]
MASPSQSLPKLFELPEELFQMILAEVTDASDYLHLAATCKPMWNKLDPLYQCILLNAAVIREQAKSVRRIRNEYGTILSWYLMKRKPDYLVRPVVNRYLEVFPEAVYGSRKLGLQALWYPAMECDHLGAFQMAIELGTTPPLEVQGRECLILARSWNCINIILWLMEQGVDAKIDLGLEDL